MWALDFDNCARYPFVADIAFALRELFGDRPAGVNLTDERFGTFMSGYRAVRDVSDTALSHIPLFLAAHNLLSYAKLRRTLADAPYPDEPDWLISLRRRLEEKVEGYEHGFADDLSV